VSKCGGATVNGTKEEVPREQALVPSENIANSDRALEAGTETARKRQIPAAIRRHLPDERCGITQKFSVGGEEGYVTVGLFEDGLPGEMFIVMSKEGSTVSGLMDSIRHRCFSRIAIWGSAQGPL